MQILNLNEKLVKRLFGENMKTKKKTKKIKRNFQFAVIGLTIIDPKTKDIRVKELKIRSNKKKKVIK